MKRKLFLVSLFLMLTISLSWSYTRDWSNTLPIDHTLNKNWPSEDRKLRVDISDRLDDILNGFASGETVTDFDRVPLHVRAEDDVGVANTIILYGKDVDEKTELFAVDEDDNVIQITTGGKINTAALEISSVSSLTAIMEYVYPVGSVVTLGVSTNPATLFGVGTWTAIEGRVIVGIAASGTFDTLNETMGAETVSVAHTHTISKSGWGRVETTTSGTIASAYPGNAAEISSNLTSGAMSANATASIIQPTIVKYVWQRTE